MLSIEEDIEAQKEGVRMETIAEEQTRTRTLTDVLEKAGRLDDLLRALREPEYKTQLLKEFGIE